MAAAALAVVSPACGDDQEESADVRGRLVRHGTQLNEGDVGVGVASVDDGEASLHIAVRGEGGPTIVTLKKGATATVGGHTIELVDTEGSGNDGYARIDIDPDAEGS